MIEKQGDTLELVKDIENNRMIIDYEDQDINDEGTVFSNILKEYEKIVVKSLVTSFGLDFLLSNDRKGGDVDTVHTVRDKNVLDYANKKNQKEYDNHGKYDKKVSSAYHSSHSYISKNRTVGENLKNGNFEDAYTGQIVKRNAHIDLDHGISAKEIHDDPGRILAGLEGIDLANTDSNLNATDHSINRSMGKKSIDEFAIYLENTREQRQKRISELKSKDTLNDNEKKELHKVEQLEAVDINKLKETDKKARDEYNANINKTYYSSKKFMKDVANASLKSGAKLGLRQALGTIFMEIWITVREDMPKIIDELKGDFELGKLLQKVGETLKRAFENVKIKYNQIILSFKDGALAGILSSISSTLINIFFTTAKCVGRILRESWASIIEAIKILVYNPDDLPFGEILRAVAKITATSVSVICGSLVQEAVSKMIPVGIPIIGDVLPMFIGSMVTGIMTVSMLYFLDRSSLVKKIVGYANSLKTDLDLKLDYFKEVNKKLAVYVSELASIDYATLEKEIDRLKDINRRLSAAVTVDELNRTLHNIVTACHIKLPYQSLNELDSFMNDKDAILII